ncbi:MAG: biopolymer transporter ExbD [Myxococcota bacterium]|nr:biopolymer transporter ExbD [Myxococcota bacterium]MEC9390230.1 biopolymer transporter ExbD [Myxococcota bacterium]
MNFSRSRRVEAGVDVTPLIDIIFQLVLFFMVSTTFVTAPGLEVDLPRSSADTVLRDTDDVSVLIADDGSVYIDEQPVDFNGLNAALERVAARDPNTLVMLKADRTVSHGRVVAIMDAARSNGLTRLAIATEIQSADRAGPAE